jgi:hypothetical protein
MFVISSSLAEQSATFELSTYGYGAFFSSSYAMDFSTEVGFYDIILEGGR